MSDTKDPTDKYPGFRDASEAVRLRAQHDLCKAAHGGLVQCLIDLTLPNLRILDSGTADGYWLYDLLQENPALESAELIGTDIAPFKEGTFERPGNLKLVKQDMLAEWPKEWQGSFDFVHQRNAMANTGNEETAIETIRKLIRLVKPGGYIQIVDGYMPTGKEIEEGDKASVKLFKVMGRFLEGVGLKPDMSPDLERLVREAGGKGWVDVSFREGTSRQGKGASGELYETGFVQMRGLGNAMKTALEKMKDPPISLEDWPKLNDEVLKETLEEGVDMYWSVAWGRKV